MGKIAFISDVHACAAALDKVIEDMDAAGVDRVVCLGDIVGYGPEPECCLGRVRAMGDAFVLGNHDAMMVAKGFDFGGLAPRIAAPLALARREVSAGNKEWIEELPLSLRLDDFEICHASLHQPALFTHLTKKRDIENHFARQAAPFSFFGHTHQPKIFHLDDGGKIRAAQPSSEILLTPGGKYAIGVGAVAFSRDGDPRASWVLFDSAVPSVSYRRVPFDYDGVAVRMREIFGSLDVEKLHDPGDSRG